MPETPEPKRKSGLLRRSLLPIALTVIAATAVLLPQELSYEARVALFGFALATILWSTTRINSAYVALMAVMITIFGGGSSQEELFESLASDVIWLMIGAFILGGAMRSTGLAARLTGVVVNRAKTVRGVFFMVTTVLLPLSFFIPSTSGRAAVMMPVFRSLSDTIGDKKVTRALALLIPTVILVATISTLIGAGSHLIAIDLLDEISDRNISFAQWALWGVPFGVTAAYLSCLVVMGLFLDRERLGRPLVRRERRGDAEEPNGNKNLSRNEKFTLFILLSMVGLWLTEALHGIEIATVTVAGALILTLPLIGVMKWKEGLKSVSWNLILFVGAALALGNALIDSGAAEWIIDNLFDATGINQLESPFLILLVIGFLSLTSHIYMTSHAARAVALVPPFLYLAASLDLNPVAVLFISTVGMDYCQTFPVSSKALLMFQETDVETFQPADLLRLSAVLLIVHVVLIVVFYYGYWQWTGLSL
ncbi:SLC13 family permease [Rubrobacter indicoceani]|uniref:SLC13 family permease n=1 Tax=Rubrobacter indicoceani TaxID=2051957 RepID=UPI003B8395E5